MLFRSKKTKDKAKDKDKDPLSMPQGPITRSRSKKLQEALISYIQDWANQGSPIIHIRFNPSKDFNEGALFNVCKSKYIKISVGLVCGLNSLH